MLKPLFRTGQECGAPPLVWLSLVMAFLNTLDCIVPERFSLFHMMAIGHILDWWMPLSAMLHRYNSWIAISTLLLADLISRLQSLAQPWDSSVIIERRPKSEELFLVCYHVHGRQVILIFAESIPMIHR
jgi:hypothetical protein